MKAFSASLITEKAAEETSSCYAIKIGSSIHYSDWDESFSYGGDTYTPDIPLRLPKFTASGGRISISNVDDSFTSLVINGTLKGESITAYEVFTPSGTPVAEVLYSGTIDSQSFTDHWATISVTPARIQAVAQCPRRRLIPACGFVFKSTSCGYTGSSARCAKSYDTCLNISNFAGFRFIPAPGKTFVWGDNIYKVE